MSDIAIRIENLSKQYRIGARQGGRSRYKSLREELVNVIQAPFRRAASLLRGQAYGAAGMERVIWALKDVSFEVRRGEVVGIIGRNGAGKTTLLKILSRITEPTEGCVELYGRVGSLLEVGTGFHPELTGRENIYLNGAILGMKRAEIERKFDEIVSFAEVEKFIDTPVKHYSSGMYVRLAFSVAAHMEPEILLVDEVLAVGDVAFQNKCLGKMESVSKQGRTVLFVSHNLGAVRRLCSRGLLLDGGRFLQDGPTEQVINQYTQDIVRKIPEYTQPEDRSKKINLRRVTLLNAEGALKTEFEYREGVVLRIEYQVNEPVRDCAVWAAVRTMDGTEVFVTADYDTTPALLSERGQGYYSTIVRFPGRWLNAGSYYVVVGITGYVPLVFGYDRVEAVYFSIVDSGVYPLEEAATRSGLLKPVLDWETCQSECTETG